jgi:hypothetical protein
LAQHQKRSAVWARINRPLVPFQPDFRTIPAGLRNLHGIETIDDASLNFLDLECTV